MSELSSLLELLGEEAALKIIEAYGGTRLGVPKVMPKAHKLRDLLGDSSFALLFQYFGGSEIPVPLARQWRIEVYKKKGLTTLEIARRAGCSERAVTQYIRRRRESASQFQFAFE